MKRKELQTQRKPFVEIPPPKKKKARKLLPDLKQWKIPILTKEGRIESRPLFPAHQTWEDPLDRLKQELDYRWKSIEWTLQEQARQEKLKKLEHHLEEGLEGVVKYAEAGGFLALKNQRVVEELIKLQQRQTTERNLERRREAAKWIEEIWKGLKKIGSGPIEKGSLEEKKAIVAACKGWRPVCEGLNKAFKQLRKEPEYQTSEPYRKEAIGRLAEKFSISVAEVEAIRWSLAKPSQKARKSTPTDAMFHMVAREFPGRGVKTIEKIWGDYLNRHPDEKRKKRKPPTTPIAEKTP